MKVAVIGGSGFIGSNLIEHIRKEMQYKILSYDLKAPEQNVPYIVGNIDDRSLLETALEGTDVVFLKAGILGNPGWSRDHHYFERYLHSNIEGVFNVLEACRKNKVKKIVFDSSVSVYGEEKEALFAKEDMFANPRNLYGFSKVNAERLIRMYCDAHGIHAAILRYSRVRSAQTKDVIYHFLRAIEADEPVKIYGNPLKEIEFIHIEDVVRANIQALHTDICFGQFNISTSEKVSLLTLAQLCASIADKSLHFEVIDSENNDIEPTYTRMDIRLAREMLAFRPAVTLNTMIRQTYDLIRSENA